MLNFKDDQLHPVNSLKLFGYEEYFSSLSNLYINNRFPKVIMLSGEKGLGKFTFAFHLLNYFFSKNKNESYDLTNYSINSNNTFYRNILSNINQNFNYIGSDGLKKVGIEEIRNIKKKFNNTSLNNLARFTILDDSELLNVNSANALLKLIEEPSSQNYFILINNKRRKIIDTLRSRSLEVNIFINSNNKSNILKKINEKFQISLGQYSSFINKTTPGTLLRVCMCLENIKIEVSDSLYTSVDMLLDKYKKEKNDIYIEAIKFLLDFEINKAIESKNPNFLEIGFLNKKVNKLLFEFENFNISKNSVLDSLKFMPKYV